MAVIIRGSFRRSTDLAQDYYGSRDLGGYIVTERARELLGWVADASETPSACNAWSISGPYGVGKSSFALFAARLLGGSEKAHGKLAAADPILGQRLFQHFGNRVFCPILVVGAREALAKVLLRGLAQGIEAFSASFSSSSGKSAGEVHNCRSELNEVASAARHAADESEQKALLHLYERAANAVQAATGGGLFLVVDELGKLLEYAAYYPDRSDLYVLQRLAERASRTAYSRSTTAPLLLFTILHQAFERYAGHLESTQRNEWRKVQGRFQDIAFVEPVNESIRLIAHAIQVEDASSLPADGPAIVDALIRSARFGPGLDVQQIRAHLLASLPLHPAVSLIAGPLFRRLAQNERSLFAFLASGEPYSFLDVLRRTPDVPADADTSTEVPRALPRYRLDHFYDYLSRTIGIAQSDTRMGKIWSETEEALSRIKAPTEISVRLLKQLALLDFAGPLAGLPPTTAVLHATVDAQLKDVDTALASLKRQRLIVFRPVKREYHVWQGSDFDLEAALKEARSKVPTRVSLAALLASMLPPAPLIARRHSYRTGTTRAYEVRYASDETWLAQIDVKNQRGDGRIIYVLPERDGNSTTLIAAIQASVNDATTLVAVPDRAGVLREIVHEFACLNWIRANNKDLHGDGVARREVDQQLADTGSRVEQYLHTLLVEDVDGMNPCTWIYCGETFRLHNDRALQERLSRIFDEVFCNSPRIWSELVNRSKPSASAKRGLKLLLNAMTRNGDEQRLGITGSPAEYGMYASILKVTGMHRPVEGNRDRWQFGKPCSNQFPGCASAWDAILGLLRSANGLRVPVEQVFDLLRGSPYGVRDGLIPVFILAVYKRFEHEIAVYETRTLVSDLAFDTIERLLKNPGKFHLQLVELEGARSEILHALAPLAGIETGTPKPLPIVLRILGRIHGLPPYVRKTSQLSPIALNIRETLWQATEPTTLLFRDLPIACGSGSFLSRNIADLDEITDYAKRLREGLSELCEAYSKLVSVIWAEIRQVFRLRSETPEGSRHELGDRARFVLPVVVDIRLRSFLIRVADSILDTQEWYESLAALLVQRPPAQWTDTDRLAFSAGLQEVARRFFTLEPIAFEFGDHAYSQHAGAVGTKKRIRLSVTVQYEDEQEHVICIHPEDDGLIERVYNHIDDALATQGESLETKLAAVGKLTQKLLRERSSAYSHKSDE